MYFPVLWTSEAQLWPAIAETVANESTAISLGPTDPFADLFSFAASGRLSEGYVALLLRSVAQ